MTVWEIGTKWDKESMTEKFIQERHIAIKFMQFYYYSL